MGHYDGVCDGTAEPPFTDIAGIAEGIAEGKLLEGIAEDKSAGDDVEPEGKTTGTYVGV